jgi:16S rRNA (cytidine1402-2'-O)-methyltransferase
MNQSEHTTGKLTLVPTPIGNLDDMTFRAVKVLQHCDYILAEDTRVTSHLLKHFQIQTPLRSFHQNNEHAALFKVIEDLKQGKQLAQVSDAGTPGISDPGFLLVRECLKHNIPVECLPGATAFVPALVKSGFPSDRFIFEGFLPVKKGRQTKFIELAQETRTLILYESPHRILKTLRELSTYFGAERNISVSRELSKLYEQTVCLTVGEAITFFEQQAPKGEFVLVIEGNKHKE